MNHRHRLSVLSLAAVFAATLLCARAAYGQAAAQAAEREAEIDAQAQQYVQMMRPAMWRELEFVRQTCDLSPEQRPAIKAAAEAGLKLAARNMFLPQRGRGNTPAAAAQTIRKELEALLKKTLAAEQLARYQEETAKRAESIKQATILSVVSQLDGTLFFTQQQRDKVSQALENGWQEDWEHWLSMWQYAGQYFPQVPDQHVTPHLSEEQKIVWNGLQKTTVYSWGGNNARPAGEDEWWQGKPESGKTKAKATEKTR